MMSMRDAILEKLSVEFSPDHLEVIDESARHKGHAGWREGGETHFKVRIATRQFDGKSRLAQHRAILLERVAQLLAGRAEVGERLVDIAVLLQAYAQLLEVPRDCVHRDDRGAHA